MKKKLFMNLLFAFLVMAGTVIANNEGESFTVKIDQPENGNIALNPTIPADGKMASGTVITVTATPVSGYDFDSGYYAISRGRGNSYFESTTSTFKVSVTQDMSIGASFIEKEKLQGFKVTQDVVYAQPGVKKLKYDVFSPNGAKNLPCIIIIHGGGWSTNTEDIMRGLARELVKGGKYVVFSIDYRWVKNLDGDQTPNMINELVNDVYGAIAHIQEHAKEYGGDPSRIAVTGDSAGGHLSASAANFTAKIGNGGFGKTQGVFEFMPSYLPKGKTIAQVRSEITAAIKVAAPSYGVFAGSLLKNFANFPDDAWLDAVSPEKIIPNLKERSIPQLLLRGSVDGLITDESTQSYVKALKAAGQTVDYITVEGAGHAFFDWKPDARTKATFAQYGVKYAGVMLSFFDKVFYSK